jgi:hypothetical protein
MFGLTTCNECRPVNTNRKFNAESFQAHLEGVE